jgi:MFS family permease
VLSKFFVLLKWIFLFQNTLLTFAGPLSSISINPSDVAAVATVSLFLTGTAFASSISAPTFGRLGRKGGFILGCCLQMIGAIISMVGVFSRSIGSLLTGCFIVGIGLGYGHFYRFAVLEISPDRWKRYFLKYLICNPMAHKLRTRLSTLAGR